MANHGGGGHSGGHESVQSHGGGGHGGGSGDDPFEMLMGIWKEARTEMGFGDWGATIFGAGGALLGGSLAAALWAGTFGGEAAERIRQILPAGKKTEGGHGGGLGGGHSSGGKGGGHH